ncbi:MAG: hypothetical protein JRJ00_00780 [Deltaproteobacteria bacterium]|nr:hypothetical protein [Deltaproteobacteria bacterium]
MGKKENTAIIVNGFKEKKTDDAILQELFESGVAFGELRTVFNEIIKDKGLRLTSKERKEKTDELMEGVDKIETVEEMQKIVDGLAKKMKVEDTKAMGSLRTWAKAKGIDLPKAPRVVKTRKAGFGGHYKKILDFILENRDADKKAVVAFCHNASIPEAYSTQALNVVHFAKVWNGEVQPEAEEAAEAK